jgi:hypothetical protein
MSGNLENYVGHPVIILSCDGRCFSGTLKGKRFTRLQYRHFHKRLT